MLVAMRHSPCACCACSAVACYLLQVQADSKFVDLGADSLDTVEIMMALEEKFDIQLDEEGAEKISTVQVCAPVYRSAKRWPAGSWQAVLAAEAAPCRVLLEDVPCRTCL